MRDWSQEHWQQVDRLFVEALDRPTDERDAFLAEQAAGDARLLADVRRLLADAEAAEGLLDVPVEQAVSTLLSHLVVAVDVGGVAAAVAGRKVGPYRIVEPLGEGGMGAVYLAERDDVPMRVALKLVRGELASPQRLERFYSERRLLARLQHPNIATLLDAGLTEDGRPYYAMELVAGEPLTAYCDRRRLPVEGRLRLFEQVCEAVHYAHQRLVVHRDLKPSNILVTEDAGGEPQVKLLDFGIAKGLSDDDATLTRDGARPMTPDYAAPEQVLGEPVTTATDVYALGVLLYELLTGRRPLALSGKAPRQQEAAILMERPEPPSAAARTLPGTHPEDGAAYRRDTTPDRLRRRLEGDLDTIVMTALRKEADRRYPSAEALLEDLRRYRLGRPVAARPDSAAYRAGKFVRRHRWPVAVAALFVLLLLAFSVMTAFQSAAVARERDEAARQRDKARAALTFLAEQFEGTALPAAQADSLPAEPEVRAEVLKARIEASRKAGNTTEAERLTRLE